MGKWESEDSFISTFGRPVASPHLTPVSVQPIIHQCWEIYIVLEEQDEFRLLLLVSKIISNEVFE